MASISDLSIRRPVATAMFYLVVITIGVVAFRFLPVDLLPAIEYPQLSIGTSYANVGPEEMEQLITRPIENGIAGVPGVERVTSSSSEGSSRVRLEFGQGTDLAEAANDVRDALERLRGSLPEEAEEPRIWKFDPNDISILSIAASSTRDLETLTQIIERDIVRRLEQIDGVGTIQVRGGVYREIHVNIKRDRLRSVGLTAEEVQNAIGRENAIAPGGNVKDGLKDLYVRAIGEYESIDQVADVVITRVDGRPVRVRDVANVRSDYEDVGRLTEVNGTPVVQFRVQKQSGANTVSVSQDVRAELERINADRNDINLTVISDQSTFIQQSIDNVQSAAIWGSLLAIFVLYFFLRNGSTTFIIALSIPISLIATFGLLYFGNLSLNMMTFGGLALGIGLIVDNAIVVLENIIRQREEQETDLKEAASVGTREVAGAIIASTLTTSVIFLPIMFMQGTTSTLFLALALVVVFSLACSLLVALTLVPMLSSQFLTVEKGTPDAGTRGGRFRRKVDQFERWYAGKVRAATQQRLAIFGIATLLVIGAGVLLPFVPVELAPSTDSNEIDIDLRMDEGTNLAVVASYLQELEDIVQEVVPEGAVSNIAAEISRGRGEVEIAMPNPEDRTISSEALADKIREVTAGAIPGAEVRVRAQAGLWILRRLFSGGGGDEALQLQLLGYDQEEALRVARQIRQRMERVEGIEGVRIGGEDDEGQPEQVVRLDRDRIAQLGLSIQDVGRAVQLSLGGGQAGSFREGGDEYTIRVRMQPEDRRTTQDVSNIILRTPEGETVPLSAVSKQERQRGPDRISRVNSQRVTYISANLESGLALNDAVNRVRAELSDLTLPSDFTIVFGGEYEEQQRAQRDFLIAILMALALIYMVMAGQFERFLDPLIVMFSVPLALVGVVPMLYLTGTTFNIQSFMGLIMLIGIVVNNAIVLIDYINLMRRERGMELVEAVVEAGRLRLRPILMTTVTTILALFPLAMGWGAGGEIQAPLARTVIGGLTASTLITLLLIPVIYISAHRAKAWVGERIARLRGGESPDAAVQGA
jgi:hydrophobic/amphiphilic exporter-1 (mainly G- bacteria), HAE1 family